MEGRLREAALPAVVLALARQKPFTEQTLRALQRAPLVEAFVVRDEHVADEVGMIEEKGALRPDAEPRHVAVVAREAREKLERVAPEREHVAARPPTLRPRRCERGYHSFIPLTQS